jgi:hypothetical protein
MKEGRNPDGLRLEIVAAGWMMEHCTSGMLVPTPTRLTMTVKTTTVKATREEGEGDA